MIKKQKTIFSQHVESQYELIKVKAGKCKWNFRCHNNAVHYALKNNHEHVAMVVYYDGYPIIHFINVKDGEFTDNTLGEWSRYYDYHLVRLIHKSEFQSIHRIFSNFRATIHKMMPWYLRWFLDNNY